MKAQIFLQLNNKQEALKNVQKSLDLHPRFDKGWLLSALLNEQVGQLKDAIKGYTSYLEVSPGANRDIESHLLQLIFRQKMIEQNQSSTLVMNKQCFDKALMLFDKKQYDQALLQIEACIKERPDDDQAKLLKVQILSSMQKPEKAADVLKEWIALNPNKDIWYKTLHLLTASNLKPAYAIKVLTAVEKRNPTCLLPVLYLADLYTRNNMTEQAVAYLDKSFAMSTDLKIKERVLHQLALAHYQAKNFVALNAVVTQAQELKSTFAPLLNLFAYYYAEYEHNTQKAQELIHIVLKQDKNNPHFLDTQAFIYLTDKKYEKAVALLEKIAQKIPSDYTVLMHLAQARHGKGEKQQALLTLRQAQRCAGSECDKKECENLVDQWQQTKKI